MLSVNRDCIQFKLVMKKNDKPFKGTEFPSTQVKKEKKEGTMMLTTQAFLAYGF